MSKRILILALIVISLIISLGYIAYRGSLKEFNPTFSYEIGGCEIKRSGELKRSAIRSQVDVEVRGAEIALLHELSYFCCAELVLELKVVEGDDYSVLRIFEENVGEICRCICDYEISIRITDLKPGRYKLEIYGVEHEEAQAEKLWEGWAEVKSSV